MSLMSDQGDSRAQAIPVVPKGFAEDLMCAKSGSIPGTWADNTRLTSVNLSNNTLTGSLPADWSRLSQLQSLNASANLLTGTLPASWRGVGANGTVSSGLVNLTSL